MPDPVYYYDARTLYGRLTRLVLCTWLQCHVPSRQRLTRPGFYFLAPCVRCEGMHGWRKGTAPRWIAQLV